MTISCEFCKNVLPISTKRRRFCNPLCQRKHYNRRPEIRENIERIIQNGEKNTEYYKINIKKTERHIEKITFKGRKLRSGLEIEQEN